LVNSTTESLHGHYMDITTGECGHSQVIPMTILLGSRRRITPCQCPTLPQCRWETKNARSESRSYARIARPKPWRSGVGWILRAAAPDRPSNLRVAVERPCDRHTVCLWRRRSLAQGRVGLQEAPRSGRPRRFSPPLTRAMSCRRLLPSPLTRPVEPRAGVSTTWGLACVSSIVAGA
jgi:hypothetical protein